MMCMKYWQIYQNGQVRVDAQKEQLFWDFVAISLKNTLFNSQYANNWNLMWKWHISNHWTQTTRPMELPLKGFKLNIVILAH